MWVIILDLDLAYATLTLRLTIGLNLLASNLKEEQPCKKYLSMMAVHTLR